MMSLDVQPSETVCAKMQITQDKEFEFCQFMANILKLSKQSTNEDEILDLVSMCLEDFVKYADEFLLKKGLVHHHLNCIFFSLVAEKYEILLKKCCRIPRATFKEIEVHLTGILLPLVGCSRFLSLSNSTTMRKLAFLAKNRFEESVQEWREFQKLQQNLAGIKALFGDYHFGQIQLSLTKLLIDAFAKLKEEICRSREPQHQKNVLKTETKTNEDSEAASRCPKTSKQCDKDKSEQQRNKNTPKQQCHKNAPQQQRDKDIPKQQCDKGAPKKRCDKDAPKQQCGKDAPKQECDKDASRMQCDKDSPKQKYGKHEPRQQCDKNAPKQQRDEDAPKQQCDIGAPQQKQKCDKDRTHQQSVNKSSKQVKTNTKTQKKNESQSDLHQDKNSYCSATTSDLYAIMKDIGSLGRIMHYMDLAVAGDIPSAVSFPCEKLLLERALQVTGEYLKSTEDAPHLSNATASLLHKAGVPIERIACLRNLLSHCSTFLAFTQGDHNAADGQLLEKVKQDLARVKSLLLKVYRQLAFFHLKIWLLKSNIVQYCASVDQEDFVMRIETANSHKSLERVFDYICQHLEQSAASEFGEVKESVREIKFAMRLKAMDKVLRRYNEVLKQRLKSCAEDQQATPILGTISHSISTLSSIKHLESVKGIDEFHAYQRMGNQFVQRHNASQMDYFVSLIMEQLLTNNATGAQIKKMLKKPKYGFASEFKEYISNSKMDSVFMLLLATLANSTISSAEQNTLLDNFIDGHISGEVLIESLGLKTALSKDIINFLIEFKQEMTSMVESRQVLTSILENTMRDVEDQLTTTEFQQVKKELCKMASVHAAKQKLLMLCNGVTQVDKEVFDGLARQLEKDGDIKKWDEYFTNRQGCKTKVNRVKDPYDTLLKKIADGKGFQETIKCFQAVSNELALDNDCKSCLKQAFSDEVEKHFVSSFYSSIRDLARLQEALGFDPQAPEKSLQLYETSEPLRAVVEMLVLKSLTTLKEISSSVYWRLEKLIQTSTDRLLGQKTKVSNKSLRNYLAHGDALVDTLNPEVNRCVLLIAWILANNGHALIELKNMMGNSERTNLLHRVLIGQHPADVLSHVSDKYSKQIELIKTSMYGKDIDWKADLLKVIAPGNNSEGPIISANLETGALSKMMEQELVNAICFNDLKMTDFVLSRNLLPKQKSQMGYAVYDAVENGSLQVLAFLLHQGFETNAGHENLSPLHLAVINGNPKATTCLLQFRADVNAPDNNGLTSLHWASLTGQSDIISVLLQQGADVNILSMQKRTPLHLAAMNGHQQAVCVLVNNGSKVDIPDSDFLTPLHFAARDGHDTIVAILLDANANGNGNVSAKFTPLHAATKYGHQNVVQRLLDSGADVNSVGHQSLTPLHIAIFEENIEIAQLLEQQGADLYHLCQGELSPLHIAAKTGNAQVARWLLKKVVGIERTDSSGRTALHFAARGGHWKIVSMLLEENVSVNASCQQGLTPLHDAVDARQVQTCRLLLERGADVNASNFKTKKLTTDANGPSGEQWPLLVAAVDGDVDLVNTLVEFGADVNKASQELITSLHGAASEGHKEVVDTLLEHGASVNASDSGMMTALHLSAKHGHVSVTKTLLQNGACINAVCASKRSALTFAAESGFCELMELLLDHGADVINRDWSPIHAAVIFGHPDPVRTLLKHGCDADITDKYGQSPLHFACLQGCKRFDDVILSDRNNVDKSTQMEVINVLFEAKASPNVKDSFGNTPLHYAAEAGDLDVIKAILDNHGDRCARDEWQNTPLQIAERFGHTECCMYLSSDVVMDDPIDDFSLVTDKDSRLCGMDKLECEEECIKRLCEAVHGGKSFLVKKLVASSSISSHHVNEHSLLHTSVANGDLAIAGELIKSGKADVNYPTTRNDDFLTPLHLSVQFGYQKMARLILESGAEVLAGTKKQQWSALHLAAQTEDKDIAELLMDATIDIDVEDINGDTPLFLACQCGHQDIVDLLLQKGAKINLTNKDGNSPLHYCMFNGNTVVAQVLMSNGASINCANKESETPLHIATKKGHIHAVEFLLSKGAFVDGSVWAPEDTATPLHLAVAQSQVEIVKTLVKNRADVNCKNRKKRTALHLAAYNGHHDICCILCSNGARINSADIDGFTPLLVAVKEQHVDVVRLLLGHGADLHATCGKEGWTAAQLAVLTMDMNILEDVLEHGANANSTCRNGMTALHLAVWKESLEGVKILLQNWADVNACDLAHRMPLHMACEQGCHDIIQCLLQAGAMVNASNGEGRKPLFLATKMGTAESMQLLIDGGADVNADNKDGITALHAAITRMDIAAVNALLINKADVEVLVEADMSYLHCACMVSNADVVRRLLGIGLSVHDRMTDGATPLHIAALRENVKIVDVLLGFRADINAVYPCKTTPLRVAIMKKNTVMAMHLVKRGANVHGLMESDITFLYLAADVGHSEIIETLLGCGLDIDIANASGHTALHAAAGKGHLEVVHVLLKNNANADAVDLEGQTPLHLALKQGHADVVSALLTNVQSFQKADVDTVANCSLKPTHI